MTCRLSPNTHLRTRHNLFVSVTLRMRITNLHLWTQFASSYTSPLERIKSLWPWKFALGDNLTELYGRYLHCAFGHGHVEVAEHVVGVLFGTVRLEGVHHADRLLSSGPGGRMLVLEGCRPVHLNCHPHQVRTWSHGLHPLPHGWTLTEKKINHQSVSTIKQSINVQIFNSVNL